MLGSSRRTNRAAQTVDSAEVEAWTVVAKAPREGCAYSQGARRLCVPEHSGVKVEKDAGSSQSFMNCQHCTSMAGAGSGSDGSKAGRG